MEYDHGRHKEFIPCKDCRYCVNGECRQNSAPWATVDKEDGCFAGILKHEMKQDKR